MLKHTQNNTSAASSPSVAKGEPPDLLLKYSKSKILREEALEDSCADCAKQNGVDRTSDRADAEIVENTTNSSVRYNGKPQESSFVNWADKPAASPRSGMGAREWLNMPEHNIGIPDHVRRGENMLRDQQIEYMVQRFLGWRLPENFNPDAGISFKPYFNEHTDHPMKSEPTGTNLFDYTQAKEMIRYMLDGIPSEDIKPTTHECVHCAAQVFHDFS